MSIRYLLALITVAHESVRLNEQHSHREASIHNYFSSCFMQFNQVTLRKQLAINPFRHDKAKGKIEREREIRLCVRINLLLTNNS